MPKSLSLFAPLLGLLTFATIPLFAVEPAWWSQRNAIDTTFGIEDRAVAAQGQAKHVAHQAYLEFEQMLGPLGGAGAAIKEMVEAPWFKTTAEDAGALRIGQLKTLAAPFYSRLAELNVVVSHLRDNQLFAWEPAPEGDNDSQASALAVLGQVKQAFGFDLDQDQDDLPDWWEHRYLGHLESAGESDSDGDGLSNKEEFNRRTHPLLTDTDGDGFSDSEDDDSLSRKAPLIREDDGKLEVFTPMIPQEQEDAIRDRARLENGLPATSEPVNNN